MRLADEYDAAQERGEAQKAGGARNFIIPDGKNERSTKVEDLDLTRKDIFEARQIRDAEGRAVASRSVTRGPEDHSRFSVPLRWTLMAGLGNDAPL